MLLILKVFLLDLIRNLGMWKRKKLFNSSSRRTREEDIIRKENRDSKKET